VTLTVPPGSRDLILFRFLRIMEEQCPCPIVANASGISARWRAKSAEISITTYAYRLFGPLP